MKNKKNRKLPVWADGILFFIVSFFIFSYFKYGRLYDSAIIGLFLFARILIEINYHLVFTHLPKKAREFAKEFKKDMAKMTAGERLLVKIMILFFIIILLGYILSDLNVF